MLYSTFNFQKMIHVPWTRALTSFPFAAIVVCNFTYEWGIYTFEKIFPTFMKDVLNLEIKLVGDGLIRSRSIKQDMPISIESTYTYLLGLSIGLSIESKNCIH